MTKDDAPCRRDDILDVAVTPAKEALYVVGDRSLWRPAGVFQPAYAYGLMP